MSQLTSDDETLVAESVVTGHDAVHDVQPEQFERIEAPKLFDVLDTGAQIHQHKLSRVHSPIRRQHVLGLKANKNMKFILKFLMKAVVSHLKNYHVKYFQAEISQSIEL